MDSICLDAFIQNSNFGTHPCCSMDQWSVPFPGCVIFYCWGFPGISDGKESSYSVEDLGLTPGWGRSSGEGNGNPLQCSCLENSMNRGVWGAIVHGVTKGQTPLSN